MWRNVQVTAKAGHGVQRDDLTQNIKSASFSERERAASVAPSFGQQQGVFECSFPG